MTQYSRNRIGLHLRQLQLTDGQSSGTELRLTGSGTSGGLIVGAEVVPLFGQLGSRKICQERLKHLLTE